MTESSLSPKPWINGELRLTGIDNKMIALLKAIDASGSITQAAKQCGLSYKGAWQIIERANNTSPHTLISTLTGGNKGGGATLTENGRALLNLFTNLQSRHRQFLEQLNQTLIDDPATRLLLQRLNVKTSVRNQLFGKALDIHLGAVNATITIDLAHGLTINVVLSLSSLTNLGLKTGMDAILLINSADIIVIPITDSVFCSAVNCLSGTLIRLQHDDIFTEVTVLLANGETLTSLITRHSAQTMHLATGAKIGLMFTPNAPILGIKP